MSRKTIHMTLAAGLVVAFAVLCATVYSAPAVTVLIEGTIPDSKVFDGPVKVVVRELTIQPGEALPWHYHPGHAFNIVKSGTLTVEDGCGGERKLKPGEGFEEMNGRVHRGKNTDATEVIVYDTFITVAGKPTTGTFPGGESRCGPPKDTAECGNGGWRTFTHPQRFATESTCVDFVRRLPRMLTQFPELPSK